jgi:hypothetical protein
MEADTKVASVSYHVPRRLGSKRRNPRECEHATPYMVDNGVLDIYICQKFGANCYFEPNGGKQFKKICEETE